jgi:Ca2+-dependent lipid-binding protein
VTLRSAAKTATSDPAWGQDFTFGVKKPLGDAVTFKVFANNPRGQDAFLGLAVLPIAGLEADAMVRTR